MKRSFTAVLERHARFTSDFVTEPYEAAWASEARWFIRVLEISAGTAMEVRPQVSPDGLFWCHDESQPLSIREAGLFTVPVLRFGQWLRLEAKLLGTSPSAKVMISLSLKE